MKRVLFCLCLIVLVTMFATAFAEDGYFRCGDDPTDFAEKIFVNLIIDPGNCTSGDIRFENMTVTGDMVYDNSSRSDLSVTFIGSNLNRVHVECSGRHRCELSLDGSTSLHELALYPSGDPAGVITVNGLSTEITELPAFFSQGYLCAGQPEFASYAGAETSIDFQLQDLETFATLGKIDTVQIYATNNAAVTFDNVWLHRVFIHPAGDHEPEQFTVNTRGFTFIDLLDSGISFNLHNMNPAHLFRGEQRACSYVAGDVMNVGLFLLHSDGDLTVSMDRQYIDYVVFFGEGCDQSTLKLDAYQGSSWATDIYQVHIYDANAELYTKSIRGVYFLIAPDEAPYSAFYDVFERAEDLLRSHRSDFCTPEMLPYLPDADSDYWDRIDAALVWSQLMPYYNITPEGSAKNSTGHVYARHEPNVPYIYYHSAYIDKVRVLNAYGASDGLLPDYIQQKDWSSPNPFIAGGQVRLCENGGCGFNHQMSLGTVSFPTSLWDIP